MVLKLHRDPLVAKIGEHMKRRAAPPTAMFPAVKLRLATTEEPQPVAKKRKLRTADDKARLVARMLKAQDSGSETIPQIALDEKVSASLLYLWRKQARAQAGAAAAGESGPKKAGAKGNIKSLSKELSDALEHVASLKKKLRKLLGDD